MWWVYILECRGGRLYTGATTDLRRRLRSHAAGRGGRFTGAFRPVRLRAATICRSRAAALSLEERIKRLPRAMKLALITSTKAIAASAIARRGTVSRARSRPARPMSPPMPSAILAWSPKTERRRYRTVTVRRPSS
jgi:putative endonuclease